LTKKTRHHATQQSGRLAARRARATAAADAGGKGPGGRVPRKLRFAWKKNPPRVDRWRWCYRTAFWTDVGQIFGREIPAECCVEILSATSRYAIEMELREALLDTSEVTKVCQKLCTSIDHFVRSCQGVSAKKDLGDHIQWLLSKNLSKDWWRRLEQTKELLSIEVSRGLDPWHTADAKPWETWVRAVANSLEQSSFPVSVFSYESLNDHRPPTPFVQFMAMLQAELPEWLGQHEPNRGGHRWLTLSKAIQRALRSRASV
jgi:hypothetical protein